MFYRGQLKKDARKSLGSNLLKVIAVVILVGLVAGVAGTSALVMNSYNGGLLWWPVVFLLVMGVVPLAAARFFLALAQKGRGAGVNDFFEGFNQIGAGSLCTLWRGLWIFLWGLLYYLPGVVKAYAYSQSLYILADNPQLGVKDAVKVSMKLTENYKWELFVLDLSFVGWVILGIFTYGVGFAVGYAYYQATRSQVYLFLREEAIRKGICTHEQFGLKQDGEAAICS